jgi:hypothetical protein
MKKKLSFLAIKFRKTNARIGGLLLSGLILVLILITTGSTVNAAQIYKDSDWLVRWDTNLKYSLGLRVADQRKAVYNNPFVPAYNTDDGDRNFKQGNLTSNRFDVFSEFDAVYHKNWGIRLSAAAWSDTVYQNNNFNNSPATFNGLGDHRRFAGDTVDVCGRNVELLDAFFHGKFSLGSMPFSFRLGRFSLLWGETLFFGGNGIAHGMAPTDAIKLLSVPSSQFKEILMPIARAFWQLQLRDNFTLSAFTNFEWRRDRIPPAGSYFSNLDMADAGGRRLIMGLNGVPYPWGSEAPALWRGNDKGGGDNTGGFGEAKFGSWGIAARFRVPNIDADWGLYYHKYDETGPQLYGYLGKGVNSYNAARGKVGEYFLVYPRNIHMIGASCGTLVGRVNVSGEVSVRINTPLASLPRIVNLFDPNAHADNNHHPAYAVGNTFHANLSGTFALNPGPALGSFRLWDGGLLLGEVGYVCLMNITKNKNMLVTHSPDVTSANNMVLNPRNHDKHYALGFRGIWEPAYYQVFPSLDLTVPFGFGYNFSGKSPVDPAFNGGADKGGDASVGITATYKAVWKAGITYTNYFGSPRWQTAADRDFVSFNINRTF